MTFKRLLSVWTTCLLGLGLVTVMSVVSTAGAATGPVFTVMNTSESPPDGVYFRNSPSWNDTSRTYGLGVFMNERVQLQCYAFGEAVGPYADRLWYYTLNVSRTVNYDGQANQGMLNAHYINDGQNANVVDAGVPACVNNLPPVPAPPTTPVPPPPTSKPAQSIPPISHSATHAAPTTPNATTMPPHNSDAGFTVMNTSETPPDGVYFRNSPHTSDSDRVAGHGVYAGERVKLSCYAVGDAVGPYSDKLWYYVVNITRPTLNIGPNAGFLNAHYVNDGKAANIPDVGVPACTFFGSGGGSSGGGGLPSYSLPAPLPNPSHSAKGPTSSGPNPSSVDGIQLGAARGEWHRWGNCTVRDYDGPSKSWVIVVQTAANAYLIARNGMLFGWFDVGGAPGSLGCPTSNESVQGSAGGVTWSIQSFQGGSLFWSTGMDHAVKISPAALPAIRWAWNCLPHNACSYNTNSNGSPISIPNYDEYCLAFVFDAYAIGAGSMPQGGPRGAEARAFQWWTENSTGVKSPGNTAPAPGSFVVWAPYGGGSSGHIALSIGGGYAISTNTRSGTSDIHVIAVASLESPLYYGSITPGV